jgi:hypothetical protein
MAWYNKFFVTPQQLNEAIDAFKGKGMIVFPIKNGKGYLVKVLKM